MKTRLKRTNSRRPKQQPRTDWVPLCDLPMSRANGFIEVEQVAEVERLWQVSESQLQYSRKLLAKWLRYVDSVSTGDGKQQQRLLNEVYQTTAKLLGVDTEKSITKALEIRGM